jgi:two-component system sensor histidine kinase CpxA
MPASTTGPVTPAVTPATTAPSGPRKALRPYADTTLSLAERALIGIALVALLALAAIAVGSARGLASPGLLVLLLLAGAAVAGLLVVALTHVQRARARVRQLREIAAEIGLGDLTIRAPIEPADDLGRMGLSLNQMSERVARVLQAQKDLLAGVSHELRSPLARMEVALELLRQEVADDRRAQVDALLVELHEEVALLERHVERLLETQRVGVDRVLVRREELAIDVLVETVLRREHHRLCERGFTVERDLQAGQALLAGDDNALDRVLSTLVENVLRYAAVGRSLRLETARDGDQVRVRVLDRGPGLREEDCARVFEAYFRADRSRTEATGGTGLGMYLVKRIVEAHGGTVGARPREGGGLVVELTLPLLALRDQKATVRMAPV